MTKSLLLAAFLASSALAQGGSNRTTQAAPTPAATVSADSSGGSTAPPASSNPSTPVRGSVASETKPLLCGTSTTDATACYFSGNYCSFYEDFNGNFRATDFTIYDGNPLLNDFVVESGKPIIQNGNLVMPLVNNGNAVGTASIVSTTRFLNYGSFEAKFKTVGQSSVVTTFIGISNVLDEIDFEFTPKTPEYHKEVQGNWYYRGEPVYNVNFQNTYVDSDTFNNFHVYRVDWTPDQITWSADGKAFYTQTKASLGVNASRYPATPMRISFGVWQALDNAWAGPNTVNFNANPPQQLNVVVDYIKVIGTDCGGGVATANPAPSKGFTGRTDTTNWTPSTSSVIGSGTGNGNAGPKKSSASWNNKDYVFVGTLAMAFLVAVLIQ